jgi:hypothetical protein
MSVSKFTIALLSTLLIKNNFAATQIEEQLSADVKTAMASNVLDPITPHLVFDNQSDANAWLNDMDHRLKRWLPDPYWRKRYLTTIQYEAVRAAIDPQLVLSIITIESKFNKYAISNSGAEGLMQVMPFWQKQIGDNNQSLFDMETNIRYGCTILRYYIKKEHGDINKALARYNGSIGKTWYPELVEKAYNTYWTPATIVSIKNGQVVYNNVYSSYTTFKH